MITQQQMIAILVVRKADIAGVTTELKALSLGKPYSRVHNLRVIKRYESRDAD